MKKLSTLLMLSFLFFVALNFETAEASTVEKNGQGELPPAIIDGTVLSDKKIDELFNSQTEYTIKLSKEQVIRDYAKENNITEEEASQKLDSYVSEKYNTVGTRSANQPTCNWFKTNTLVKFNSKSTYNKGKQYLEVYLDVCGGSSTNYIVTKSAPLWQKFTPSSHNFQGDIVVVLYNGHFQYAISGKFYSDGTTSHQISFNAGAPTFSAGYSVGTANNSLGTAMTDLTKRDVFGY